MPEIYGVASEPIDDMVIGVNRFSELPNVVMDIVTALCNGEVSLNRGLLLRRGGGRGGGVIWVLWHGDESVLLLGAAQCGNGYCHSAVQW